jgi:hypothetical protein
MTMLTKLKTFLIENAVKYLINKKKYITVFLEHKSSGKNSRPYKNN